MFEKANRLQDPKNRITPPGSPFFRTLRILRLRPQNPKNRMTERKLYFFGQQQLSVRTLLSRKFRGNASKLS